MSDVREILNIRFNQADFVRLANNFISETTKRNLEISNKELEKINAELSHIDTKEPPDTGEIYHLFMKYAPSGENKLKEEFNSPRKIRRLAWALSYSEDRKSSVLDSQYIGIALKLIDENFRDSMLPALFTTLLKNWISSDTRLLKKMLLQRLNELDNARSRFVVLKEKSVYYVSPDGTVLLCRHLINENKSLEEVFSYLGLSDSTITYEYFSELAETYTRIQTIQSDFIEKLDIIFSFLKKHYSKDTNKKCLEKIINKAEKIGVNEVFKMKIINFCFRNIGDPATESYWGHWKGANESDRQNLEKARKILNCWLAKKFIYLFFERISVHPDRKDFWSKYIDYISNFKIYMERRQKSIFKYSNRDIDSVILNSKIGILERCHGNISAFIMELKEYYIVEFSETGGACYIYKNTNEFKPNLSNSAITLDELKHESNRQMAVRSEIKHFNLRDEGRIFHGGNWQPKFKVWIREFLNITD
jgi:hypothetical protein